MFSKRETIESAYPLEKLLRIYEQLRGIYPIEYLIKELPFQANRAGIYTEEEDGDFVAIAFTWHILDPYDVMDRDWQYPGENPNGNYLYIPLLWIKESKRSYGFLVQFLRKLLKKHLGAKRIAFRRKKFNKELHVLRFKNAQYSKCSSIPIRAVN